MESLFSNYKVDGIQILEILEKWMWNIDKVQPLWGARSWYPFGDNRKNFFIKIIVEVIHQTAVEGHGRPNESSEDTLQKIFFRIFQMRIEIKNLPYQIITKL